MKGITLEKELRIREGMKIMGLSDLAYWSSWFATSYASMVIVSLLVSLAGGVSRTSTLPTLHPLHLHLHLHLHRGQGESLVPLYTRESVSLSLSLSSTSAARQYDHSPRT